MEVTKYDIIRAVCHVWCVDRATIFKDTRHRTTIDPRGVIMQMMYRHLLWSFDRIGHEMKRKGGRAFVHTSVIHSVNAANNLYTTDLSYRKRVDTVSEILLTGIYPDNDAELNRNMKYINTLRGNIGSAKSRLNEMMSDEDNRYVNEIQKLRDEVVSLGSHLGQRIAAYNHTLWRDRKVKQ